MSLSVQQALKEARREAGELLARRDAQARDLDPEVYREDPEAFIRDVLREDPWSRQVDVIDAFLRNGQVAVVTANSCGKDWLAARLALWWAYCRGGLVLATAPTARQIGKIIMKGEVQRAFRRSGLAGEVFMNELRIDGDARILGFTSTSASAMSGFHDPRGVMVLVTEAQGVEEEAFEGLMSCATGERDRFLVLGNALFPEGFFFRACHSNDWAVERISALDHPNLTGERRIPGGPTRAWINKIAQNFGGEGSPIYQSRVEARFPKDSDHQLVSGKWIDKAREAADFVRACAEGHVPPGADLDAEAHPFTYAVDPARFGGDRSAMCVRRGPHVIAFHTWVKKDTQESAREVARIMREGGRTPESSKYTLIVDDIGLGGGVVDALKDKGWRVVGVNVGKKCVAPRDREVFENEKARLWWKVREAFEKGRIALMQEPEGLRAELTSIQWATGPDGRVRIASKRDVRAALGRSPDLADALALSFASGGATIGGTVDLTF